MIGDGWPSLSGARAVLLVLALIGVGYLFLQTRGTPSRLSDWNGNPFLAAAGAAVADGDAQPLVGMAQVGRGLPDADDTPDSNPLQSPRTVMTQGYGVGTHAPAEIWGAVDLALDSNGDGQPDPEATWGAPIYTTHRGVVHLARDTRPAGNHIWVVGIHFKTGYSHLKDFAPNLQDGQTVESGQLIGYMGASGEATGPHLDYQVWKDGVNVNPLDYGALEDVR